MNGVFILVVLSQQGGLPFGGVWFGNKFFLGKYDAIYSLWEEHRLDGSVW